MHRLHHRLFGEVAQGAGGLIEDQHVGVVRGGAGDADSLALGTGKPRAALANVG